MIKKSFEYLNSTMLTKLFCTLVRPILEYSNVICAIMWTTFVTGFGKTDRIDTFIVLRNVNVKNSLKL